MILTHKTEIIGLNIFLDKEEAMLLSYILSKYNIDYTNTKNKLKTASDLQEEIKDKLKGE